MKRVHILITGMVQGVGFRWKTNRIAQRLNLSGSVRNLPDGRVEVIAQGPQKDLETLINELKQGPGRVDHVAVDWPDFDESNAKTFRVD